MKVRKSRLSYLTICCVLLLAFQQARRRMSPLDPLPSQALEQQLQLMSLQLLARTRTKTKQRSVEFWLRSLVNFSSHLGEIGFIVSYLESSSHLSFVYLQSSKPAPRKEPPGKRKRAMDDFLGQIQRYVLSPSLKASLPSSKSSNETQRTDRFLFFSPTTRRSPILSCASVPSYRDQAEREERLKTKIGGELSLLPFSHWHYSRSRLTQTRSFRILVIQMESQSLLSSVSLIRVLQIKFHWPSLSQTNPPLSKPYTHSFQWSKEWIERLWGSFDL